MNNIITNILKHVASEKGTDYTISEEKLKSNDFTSLSAVDYAEKLIQIGTQNGINLFYHQLHADHLEILLRKAKGTVVVFSKKKYQIVPLVISYKKKLFQIYNPFEDITTKKNKINSLLDDLATYEQHSDASFLNKVIVLTSYHINHQYSTSEKLNTPIKRFYKLLRSEKKIISYVYTYAIIIGIISFSLPVGIQAIISFISGGVIFSSVYILISLVVIGVLLSGILQMMQISLVELLQQRIFTNAAFEFVFRIPKVKLEALLDQHPPELMNRFFDIMTLQKGLPKFLIEVSVSLLQIFFGLILLSLYHHFFLIFSIILIIISVLVFYITGAKGLESSLSESKYKYKVVHWLENVAQNINTFRLSNTNMHAEKMDNYVRNYLFHRKKHFRILLTLFGFIITLKTLIIGGLLILGTVLVVNGQISLGQFVASELVIILVVNAVEKLIVNMDVVYDLITAVEKISHVTDLPVEIDKGNSIDLRQNEKGVSVSIKGLSYQYPDKVEKALNNIDLSFEPGSFTCICGATGSGKHSLMKIISGGLKNYEGELSLNGFSLRDIHMNSLREVISDNLLLNEFIEGSLLENITLGKKNISFSELWKVINEVKLNAYVSQLPEGLDTKLQVSHQIDKKIQHKIIMARCLISKPELLIINDHYEELSYLEKYEVLHYLLKKYNKTLIVISNHKFFWENADQVVLMDAGKIVCLNTPSNIVHNGKFKELILKAY